MNLLNWPGPEIDKRRSPTYEWAFIKAHLEGESNERSHKVYVEMFGHEPKAGVPYWLVRLHIYYAALKIGYERTGKKQPSIEQTMLACLNRSDVNELRSNAVLIHHVRMHDFEDVMYGGREVVEAIAK
jgi:hypothetical protein